MSNLLTEGSQSIKYLELKARDIFLLFDVPAKSCAKLKSGHQSWQSWVAVDGQFEGGKEVQSHGVNFFHQNKIGKPISYCVTISTGKPTIESPDIEGYYGEKVIVQPSKNCACQNGQIEK